MKRPQNKISTFLLGLALLAFVVRGMIPAGFMPGHNANKLFPIVICSGAGAVTINVTADKLPYDPHPQQPHGHDNNMSCSYAQSFAQGVLADQPELPVHVVSQPVLTHQEIALSLQTAVKNYFSHGPPSIPA